MKAIFFLFKQNVFLKEIFLLVKNSWLKYNNKNLKLGFSVNIQGSKFGKFNYVASRSIVSNCKFDNYSYVGADSIIQNSEINKYCSIGPRVLIGLGDHPVDQLSTIPIFYSTQNQLDKSISVDKKFVEYQKILIGNDVWIGAGCIIKAGVTIGDGVIIGAGSVVTKDLQEYGIYAGVPAKLIRTRFTPEQIKILKDKPWYDLEEKTLIKYFNEFNN